MKTVIEVLQTINNEADYEHDRNLILHGVFSSLDILIIISALEEEYGIEIPPTEINIDNFNSVPAIENMLKRLLK